MRYRKWDIIEEHADPTSELYAPLMRHGENPKRGHQVIDEHLKKYRAQFVGKLQPSSSTPTQPHPRRCRKLHPPPEMARPNRQRQVLQAGQATWHPPLRTRNEVDHARPEAAPRGVDQYEPAKLPICEICLVELRRVSKRKCSLRVRIKKEEEEAETPEAAGIEEEEEEVYQAGVLLGSVLKGRATQVMVVCRLHLGVPCRCSVL